MLCNFLIALSLLLPAFSWPVHSRAKGIGVLLRGCRAHLITSADSEQAPQPSCLFAVSFSAKSFSHVSTAEPHGHIFASDGRVVIVLIMECCN